MSLEPQISFHGVDASAALQDRIAREVRNLQRFSTDVTSCRVVVERAQRGRQHGDRYAVRVLLAVPGAELVAGGAGHGDDTHADPFVAVRDAFDAARRQLEDHVRIRRGDVKTHATPQPQ